MEQIFTKLGIRYLDEIRFEKAKVQKKTLDAWRRNKDPSKKWFSACFEKELKNKEHPKISLRYVDNRLQYGVFAEEDIGTHRFIGEYTGVIKRKTLKMIRNYYCVAYPVGFDSFYQYVIDAKEEGNFTRFLNHSKSPNVEMKSALFEDGLIHMIFIAKGLIRKGEPLTLNYGKKFWFFTEWGRV